MLGTDQLVDPHADKAKLHANSAIARFIIVTRWTLEMSATAVPDVTIRTASE
jgi:hypothetical protein